MMFVIAMVTFILFNIYRAEKKKKDLHIRRIPGLNAIDDAIGRATEMGKPVLMVPGIGDLNAISMQALNIFAQVTKAAAQFATPIRLCTANPAVYTVAQEVIRDVYQQQGLGDRYDPDSVRFVTDRQFAFAAGVSGLILREKVAAAFFLGEFFAESLIFAETANGIGAIQVAGSTEKSQTPFFIAACDYVLIGDEFYAASAYLTRQPILVGSLVGQDWSKLLIAGTVFLGFIANSVQLSTNTDIKRMPLSAAEPELWKTLTPEQQARMESAEVLKATGEQKLPTKADTPLYRLFNPMQDQQSLDVTREKKEPLKLPTAPEAGGGE